MNASVNFSPRDLRMENIRDTARRIREANRRTLGEAGTAPAQTENLVATRAGSEERDPGDDAG